MSIVCFWRAWRQERLGVWPPLGDYRTFYRPMSRWIADEKRRRRPSAPFVFAIQGAIGAGKSTIARLLAACVQRRLSREDGPAIALSLDDYYLPLSERMRPEFIARGYKAGWASNRGPAGTHDISRLAADLAALDTGRPVELPVFDKRADDRSGDQQRVAGRVGVVILEGWFLGARIDGPVERIPEGLVRSAAEALAAYQPVFERFDALLALDRPPLDEIQRQREEQERTLERRTGRRGMIPEQVRRFVRYFYEDSWEPGLSAPEPPGDRVTFRARLDSRRHIRDLRPPLA